MSLPTSKIDALVKSPDAALRRILSHCGVRQVRLIPSDVRALPANFLARPENSLFVTFYDSIKIESPNLIPSQLQHKSLVEEENKNEHT